MSALAALLYFSFASNLALSFLVGIDSVMRESLKATRIWPRLLFAAFAATVSAAVSSLAWGSALGPLGLFSFVPFAFMAISIGAYVGLDALFSLAFKGSRFDKGFGASSYAPLLLSFAASLVSREANLDPPTSALAGLSCAAGYALSIGLMRVVQERLLLSRIPEKLKGAPILLVSAGLVSLSFLLFERIFG
jgi:electron transport complex protein RnfA